MPIDDDEDLFDAPRPKPSNKIVYQPAGAQWSLDRLGEVENLYQTSFKKKLPLVNRGQGTIHNRWGYDHRNSADVSINPSTPEGQQFVEQLKKANVPFLAFSGAIPGVATGPHIHLGFPSKRTQTRFNVGAQRKTKSVASDDLFDPPQKTQSDDDLFDLTEQTLPSTPQRQRKPAVTPASGQSARSIPEGLLLPAGQRNRGAAYVPRHAMQTPQPLTGERGKLMQQFGQQRTIEQAQREYEDQVREQTRQEIRGRTGPYLNPTGSGILHLLADPVGSFSGLFKSEDEKVNEETAARLKAEQIAQSPEVTEIRKEYGAMPAAERAVVAPLARGGAGLMRVGSGVASAFGIAPNRLSEWANKRAEIIESGAANAPLRESRNLSSLVSGQPQLEEVERGIPEKIATGIADLGVGLGSIILLKKATNLPFNQLLALEAAAKASDKPVSEQLAKAGEGYALGSALESNLGRTANAALFGAPTAAQTGYEVLQGRMSPLDALLQTGVQAGAGAVLGGKRESPATTRLRDIAATEPPPSEAEFRPVPRGGLKERMQQQPATVPRIEPSTQSIAGALRDRLIAEKEQLDAERERRSEPQTKVQPPVEAQRETVKPQTPITNTASIPFMITKKMEADLRDRGYSQSDINRMTPQQAHDTLASDNTPQPQKFYHRDFGEVIKTEDQSGARVGRTRVQEVNDPDKIHYVKTAQLTGAGNQRMVPVKAEPATTPETERGSTVETPVPPVEPQATGEAGFLNVTPEKVEYKPATTPVLKDVERATLNAENQRPSLGQYRRRATSYLQRALVAEFTPLRELEANLYGKENVPVVNMARKFEQVAGAPAKAQADIIDFRRAVIDPIRKSADDFNSYLFLKRVADRINRDPERKRVADWTTEKAQAGLDELRAKVGDETYQQFQRAGNAYQREMNKALRLQVESGRMSEDLYDQIVNSRDFYAPFKVLRHIEESDFLKGSGRRVATTQELTKKISGIEKEDFQLGNILQASAEQIVRSRILAEKNLKMLELDKLADLDPKGDLIRRVEGDERPRQGYEFVRFLKDGKEQTLEVQHVVADAVQGLNPKQASLLSQVMAMARKPLQLGATSANAGFQAVNLFFADLPRQALVSRYGVKSPRDIYQFPLDWTYSLMTSMKGNFGKPNKLYMDWLRSGAANSTVQRELTPESFRPTLGIAKPGVRNLGRSVVDSVAKFSNAIEETSKILGLQRGMRAEQIAKMSPAERQQAMEKIAAEVRNYSGSPDFARKGSETRELNLLFMFFNARLQGLTSDLTRLAGQTGKKESVAAWARLGVAIGIPSTMLAILNNSPQYKDDYDKIPDWEKKNYWMIPRESYFKNEDTGETIRDYWRIPKRELGQLFGNTIESAVEFAMKHDPKTAKAWGVDMLENISPINIQGKTTKERAESAFSGLNPALKLPAELIMNRDTFRHRDIVPDYMSKAAPAEQYRESTPRPYRTAGRALGVSPLQLEHVVEGATGSAASQFNIRPQPEGRSSLAGYPIFRRFFRSGATAEDDSLTQAQQDAATKQLQRRRERQDAIRKYRAGQITKEELDRLEQEDKLTESDVKRVEKESGVTPRQVSFYNKPPVDALASYERMTPAQQDHVKDIMARKAYTLLNSEALTETQKEEFRQRIEALGIEPEAPRRKSSNPFSQRFRSTFK